MSFLLTNLMGVIPMDDLKCKTWWELFEPTSSQRRNYPIFDTIYRIVQDESLTVLQWLDSDFSVNLDIAYIFEHSGSKHPSIAVERSYKFNNEDVELTMKAMATIIIQKFAEKWDKLYSAITTNYKPLENYDMEQTETPDITHTNTTQSETITEIEDDVTGTDIYGFNSSSPVPNNKVTRNGTSTVSNDPDNNVETNVESGTRGLTRHGNIGVTTSQQMLQSEIDLRNNYNFLNNIMDDVDSILCNLVY